LPPVDDDLLLFCIADKRIALPLQDEPPLCWLRLHAQKESIELRALRSGVIFDRANLGDQIIWIMGCEDDPRLAFIANLTFILCFAPAQVR
jgi:hypothetical protein